MTTLSYKPTDPRTIWVFQVDLSAPEITKFQSETYDDNGNLTGWPLNEALGATSLDHDGIELFDVKTIKEYGFSTYLIEANGMDETAVTPMAPQLDDLKGHVLLVHGSAFNGQPATMMPKHPLRHIATFTEALPKSILARLEADSAKGQAQLNTPQSPPSPPAQSNRRTLALIALVLAALAVIVIAKVAT